MASIIERLSKLDLENNAVATLTYEDGADVLHYNESEIETALSETGVVESLADLLATPRLDARDSWAGESILQSLRDQDFLEEYERDGDFAGYLTEMINDNFHDVELIDHSTEKYDHKRGYTTLTATVKVPVTNLIEVAPWLSGWKVSVTTADGVLMLD